jgi:hypothetical protein
MNLREQRIPTIAASVSFWAWCGLLSYPMITLSNDLAEAVHTFTTDRTAAICQAVGLLLFLTTMSLGYFARIGSIIAGLSLSQIAILLIMYLSLALQFHDDEVTTLTGIFYTALILVTALTLSALWTLASADFERCMSVASVILCLFGISAIAILGLPQGRNVGGIQPNLFAAPLLAGFIFSQFRAGSIGIAVRIACFSMAALVSSRFALIGCISALVLHELTFNPLSPGKIPALIIALVAGILFWPQIVSVLALDDSSRDLSSGFTGRDEYWHLALAAITNHPLGIGFKRAIGDEAGHNGYLKTFLEFGVAGGGLIIFLIGCVLVIAGVEAVRSSGKDRRFASARFGGLVALAFGAFFQPQLFSLGDAFGMSFLFLLFKPRMNAISDRSPASGTIGPPIHLG